MRVLILGAGGFIGARVAREAIRAGWQVRAGARDVAGARRRNPGLDWVRADFAELTNPETWAPLLDGVDAVVNCVGVLQDALGDSSRTAHVDGPSALVKACEGSAVRRVIHLSAVGVDADTGAAYAADKRAGEALFQASALDWLVVRPSLVVAREAYGGTALIRGLAGLPGVIAVVGGDQLFRPVAIDDLARLLAGWLAPGGPSREVVEVAGPQSVTLAELVIAYRDWLGFPPAPLVRVPRWAALPVLKLGDLAAWLGWTSALRTTSLRQLDHDVSGRAPAAEGLRPFSAVLADEPAGVQDRWHARLYFIRPAAVVVLGLYWLLTGLLALGPAAEAASAILERAGLGSWAWAAAQAAAGLDVVLALGLFVRRITRVAALGMLAAAAGYLVVGTLRLGGLWFDPLGPWLKVLPMMLLCLFVAATDDRR